MFTLAKSVLACIGLITGPGTTSTPIQSKLGQEKKIALPILNHISVLQELKARFKKAKKIKIDSSLQFHLPSKTQTEAYMSVDPEIFKYDRERYQSIINTALLREKQYAPTHYVLYHAHTTQLMIFHDFIKFIHAYEMLQNVPNKFHFIRHKSQQINKFINVNEFLNNNSSLRDYEPDFKKLMISVNLSLFAGYPSECTFEYFMRDQSMRPPQLVDVFSSLFDYYSFDKKYIHELFQLTNYLSSKSGNLIQIFIPKEKIDTMVYLSRAFGIPYNEVIVQDVYDHKNKRHTKISSILELYCKKPSLINDIDSLQARVVFFPDMFEPNNGIKMFRYNTISPEKLLEYEEKMKDIIDRMMDDYLLQNPQRTEPLFKLHNYIQMNN